MGMTRPEAVTSPPEAWDMVCAVGLLAGPLSKTTVGMGCSEEFPEPQADNINVIISKQIK